MKIDFTALTSGALTNAAAAHLLNLPLTQVKFDNIDTGRVYVTTTQLLRSRGVLEYADPISLPKSEWRQIVRDIKEHFEDHDLVNEDWCTAAYQGVQRIEYMNLATVIEERIEGHYKR